MKMKRVLAAFAAIVMMLTVSACTETVDPSVVPEVDQAAVEQTAGLLADTLLADLEGNLSEEDIAALSEMSAEEIQQYVELLATKQELLDRLIAAFETTELNVYVDKVTGEITFDSAILFDFDSSEVSVSGQEALAIFTGVYCDVVFAEEYIGFVEKIIIEGHTDTQGDYDYNKTLSQERADSVKDYCVSVAGDYADQFGAVLESIGYSEDDPIYDENGEVDMAASRRVAFKFMINVDWSAE